MKNITINSEIYHTKTLLQKLGRVIGAINEHGRSLVVESLTVDLLCETLCCVNIGLLINGQHRMLVLEKQTREDFDLYRKPKNTKPHQHWVSSILKEHADDINKEIIKVFNK